MFPEVISTFHLFLKTDELDNCCSKCSDYVSAVESIRCVRFGIAERVGKGLKSGINLIW